MSSDTSGGCEELAFMLVGQFQLHVELAEGVPRGVAVQIDQVR